MPKTPRVIAPLLLALVAAQAFAQEDAPPALAGRWISASPEPMGAFFATRDFSFQGDRWSIVFHAYADKEARQPLFTLRNRGAFALGGLSSSVPGAWEGVFAQTSRTIVADSDAGAAMFAQMGCTLVKGQVLAVMQKPCGFVAPLMRQMGEYDLVAFRQGRLFFGDRAGDLGRSRPEKLTPFPLIQR